MSRDSGGTFTLVAGNPVVTGTVIESNWANNTMNDLASGLTDSLSRTGKGAMAAPLKATNGAVSAPSYTFDTEITSGIYRSSTGDIRFGLLGIDLMRWTAGNIEQWDIGTNAWTQIGDLAIHNWTEENNFEQTPTVDGSPVITEVTIVEVVETIVEEQTLTINAQTGTAYQAILTDNNNLVTMDNAAANAFTVPPFVTVAWDIGTILTVRQKGAGQTTIVAGAGVTIAAPVSKGLKITEQGEWCSIVLESLNVWSIAGVLEA